MAAKDSAAPVEAEPVKVAAPAAPVKETESALTLDEFCIRLSVTDRRVEMISGFRHVESKKNRQKDTETAYRARFEAFVKAPA